MKDQYEIEVFCPAAPPAMSNWLAENGVKVIRGDFVPTMMSHYNGDAKFFLSPRTLRYLKNVKLKKNWHEIEKAIETSKPDVVAVNSMTLSWMGPLLKEKNITSVCFHRETYAKGLLGIRTNQIKKWLRHYFDAVIFISKYDQDVTGHLKGRGTVITDKVDLELYSKQQGEGLRKTLGMEEHCFYTAYLGGIYELKGAHVILKAMSLIKDPEIRLLFLQFNRQKTLKTFAECQGIREKIRFLLGMDYEAKVLKLIQELNLWERVDFFPSTTKPEAYITASDVIVFPSIEPHQARPLYEAGAAKRPIIITDFKQTREFAKDQVNALTFENLNPQALASKIILLKENHELYQTLVANNYAQSCNNHQMASLAQELDEVFQKL